MPDHTVNTRRQHLDGSTRRPAEGLGARALRLSRPDALYTARTYGINTGSFGVGGWQRIGHVYVADAPGTWASSHAYCPTPLLVNTTTVRVYCAFLDARGVGRIRFVDGAAHDPPTVLAVSTRPALNVGRPGRFDEQGVTPISAVPHPDGERAFL